MEKISITGILRTPSGHPYKTRIRVNCISSSIAVPNTFMEYTSDHMGSYSFYLVPGTYNVQVEFNRRFIDFGLLTVKPEDIKEVFNLQEIIERTRKESELGEDLEKVLAFKKYILNTLYPVGSIYTSFENKNPGEFLGGTWELIQFEDESPDVDYTGVPVGTISMWAGSVGDIPAGWQLCDGTAGTPDLRDKFVVGAGASYSPGNTGGSATINASIGDHYHVIGGVHNNNGGQFFGDYAHEGSDTGIVAPICKAPGAPTDVGLVWWNGSGNSYTWSGDRFHDTVSGSSISSGPMPKNASSSSSIDVRPPYYALCYIMKIKADDPSNGVEPEYTRVYMFKRIDAPEDAEDFDLSSSLTALLKKPAESISVNSTALVTSRAVALELEKYIKIDQIAEITDEDVDWILS